MSRRSWIPFLSAVVLLLIITACVPVCSYAPSRSREDIQKMELVYIAANGSRYEDNANAKVLQTISSGQWDQVLSEFKDIPCSEEYLDPALSTFGHVIRITYVDGTIELLSDSAIAVYDQGNWDLTSHVLPPEAYSALVKHYLPADAVPVP